MTCSGNPNDAAHLLREVPGQLLFAALPCAVAINRPGDAACLEVNPAFESLVRLSRSELIGKRPWEMGLTGSLEVWTAAVNALRSNGHPVQLSTSLPGPSGERLPMVCTLGALELSGELCVQTVLTPASTSVPEPKTTCHPPAGTAHAAPPTPAGEPLRDSEERLQEMLENAPVGIFRSSLEGRYLAANPAMFRMFGYDSEAAFLSEITNIDTQVYVRPEQRRDILQRALASTGHVRTEIEVYRRDQTILTANLNLRAVRDAGGQVKWLEGFVEDITERKRAEAEVASGQAARAALEAQLRQAQKMEAIGTLAGGIAHDFNNILGSMICYAELANRSEPGDPQIREDIAQVLKACDRAKDLVRQILAFGSRTRQDRKAVNLAPVVKEALKLLRSALPATLELRTRIDPDLPQVLADPTQIHQVLVNLCTNSAHAIGGKAGRLEVHLDKFSVGPELLPSHPELRTGDYLRLTVTDTGHGMDEQVRGRIFEPFFTTKGPGEGTGLGLSVVHGIVRDHDGAIRVDSEPGQGTTVRVYLPAHPVEIHETEDRAAVPLQGNRQRVLLVDDEPALARALERMLHRLNYEVSVETDPQHALARFQTQPDQFDLLITDLTMPGLTGTDLAAAFLTLRPNLPVLLVTGFSGTYTPDRVRELGMRGLVQKPVGLAALSLAVHQALKPCEAEH